VAFAHGALPEIVADDNTGLLVPAGDELALAKAVSALLPDPARRAAMGQAGRRRIEAKFDVVRTTRQIERVYEEAMAVRRER